MAGMPAYNNGRRKRQPRMASLSISHAGGAAAGYPSFDSDHALTDLKTSSFAVGSNQDHDGDISFHDSANDSYLDLSSYDQAAHSDHLFQKDTTDLALSSSLAGSSLSPTQFDNLGGATSHPSQLLGMVSSVTGPWNPLISHQARSPASSVNQTVALPPSTPQKATLPGISRTRSNASGRMSFQDSTYFTMPKNSKHEDEAMSDFAAVPMDQNYTPRLYGASSEMSQPSGQKKLPDFISPSQQTTLPSSQQIGQEGLFSQIRLAPRDTMSISTSQVSHHSHRSSISAQNLHQNWSCSECNHQSRTKSEYNKHKAQHERKFRCEDPGCERSKRGFPTSNDLDRHLKSVHNINNRKSKDYKCFAKGCTKPDKIWPRADNFRHHLKTMHPNEDQDDLIRMSDTWFESQRQALHVSSETRSVGHPRSINELSDPFGLFQQRNFINNPSFLNMPIDPSLTPTGHGPNRRIRRCSTPDPVSGLHRLHVPHTGFQAKNLSQGFPMKRTLSHMETSQPAVTQYGLIRQDSSASYEPLAGDSWDFSISGSIPGPTPLNAPQSRFRAYTTPNPALDINRMLDFDASPISSNIDVFSSRQDEILPDLSGNVGDIQLRSPSIKVHPPDDDQKQFQAWGQVLENDIQDFLKKFTARADSDRSFSQEDFVKRFRQTLRSLDDMTNGGSSSACQPGATSASAPSKPTATVFQCHFPNCGKTTKRHSELKKHILRHQRRFGCTFDGCFKSFGSKNDWKRHEQSQHEQEDSWRCNDPECGKVFYHHQEALVKHMAEEHEYSGREDQATQIAAENRVSRNFQGRIWCGFCNKIIVLKPELRGVEAIAFRFDHIATHFKGEDWQDWTEFSGRGNTKAQIQEMIKAKACSTAKDVDNNNRDAEARNDDDQHQSTRDQESPSPSPPSSASSLFSSPSPQSQSDMKPNQQLCSVDANSNVPRHSQYSAGAGWDQQMRGTISTRQPKTLTQAPLQDHKTNKTPHDHSQKRRPGKPTAELAEFIVCCQCYVPYNLALSKVCTDCNNHRCNLCELGKGQLDVDMEMEMEMDMNMDMDI
ncbi:hypothetical protein PV10_07564 [Exophiala mesophila]|uniref:C2H2-type domain-containing protein n=1 Tax=Exophiala mesophila TaxID=212818 RepID=A0A0D1WMI2_EXOME|nr:uncharacterized protein PV10_07564 [Exophiala mesophila]KIV90235.1 hypothetical protein PV10_07564 [Exophiala mesophila]